MVARLGGSEFVLVIEAAGAAVTAAITALDAALARPFAVADALAVLGCRFGVAQRQPGDDAAALLRRASEALAEAKASDGRCCTSRCPTASCRSTRWRSTCTMRSSATRSTSASSLRSRSPAGKITGVEALGALEPPGAGPLGADTLFDAADRADLGIALSDHIQQLVLARAAAWPEVLGTLRVSLNLTAADITRPGFAALFLARIDASGFPRGRLTVEITETGLIEDLAAASALLAELRGAGCRVAIDDFGTGYSSLAYLKSLPLDYVEDRQVAGTGHRRHGARPRGGRRRDHDGASLGLAVIAEGVERRRNSNCSPRVDAACTRASCCRNRSARRRCWN